MTSVPSPHTSESWSAASRGYAENVAPVLTAFATELVDRLDVQPTTKALEVGAGSGALTETLASRVGSLLAVDFAPGMIDLLRERLRAEGTTNVQCAVMDGQALDLPDDSFDRALCGFALMLFSDRARGFSELHRILRPGGKVLVSGWAGPDKFQSFGLFLEGVRAAFPDMPQPPSPPAIFSLADPQVFRAEMEASGFVGIEVDFVSRDLEVPDFEQVWALLMSGAPPIQALLDRVGTAGEARLRDSLSQIVEARFGGGPIHLSNVATVGLGRVQ